MTLVEIRPGVSFNEPAANSWYRMESQVGEISTNRTTVDYDVQKQLWEEWKRGEHPEIPVVLNPDYSIHVYRNWDSGSARAVDSDVTGGFWHDNGWYETNSVEPWHREYQPWNDNHINEEADMPLNDADKKWIIGTIRSEVGAALELYLKAPNEKLDAIKDGDIQYPGADYNAFEAVVGVIREDNK